LLKHGLWLAAVIDVIDLLCIGLVQGAEGLKPLPLISCRPSSSLRQVLALLATHSLHRLHILDACQRPVGIVTITDLLRVIVGATELLEAVQPVSAMGR
jgi:CBS domain-containing protein